MPISDRIPTVVVREIQNFLTYRIDEPKSITAIVERVSKLAGDIKTGAVAGGEGIGVAHQEHTLTSTQRRHCTPREVKDNAVDETHPQKTDRGWANVLE